MTTLVCRACAGSLPPSVTVCPKCGAVVDGGKVTWRSAGAVLGVIFALLAVFAALFSSRG